MKWFILKLVVAIIIATTFVCCTKFGKNITVKGRVLNPITGEGRSGAVVQLIKNGNNLAYNGGFKLLKEVTTDENGNFEISATKLSGLVFAQVQTGGDYHSIYDLGWYYEGKYYSRLGVDKGKTMNMDYHVVPYGKLKLHVFNQNCQGATDSLDIFFDGSDILSLTGKEDANNHTGSILYTPIVGCWDNTDNGFNTQMGRRFYHWTVIRNGVKTTFYDTVYVIPNQTTTLNVFY